MLADYIDWKHLQSLELIELIRQAQKELDLRSTTTQCKNVFYTNELDQKTFLILDYPTKENKE